MRALQLENKNGEITAAVQQVREEDLPDGNVLVDVSFSSLNYKDALAVTGRGDIVRGAYPFVPGIDLIGAVVRSDSDDYETGDKVIVTGWGTGEERWGGFSERQRVKAAHCVPLPEDLTPKHAMVFGTAGFTAMLSLLALEDYGVTPDCGEIVVTGASGGVGSLAVALLAEAGYEVVASTGSTDAHRFLTELGASRIIDRGKLGQGPSRPLDEGRWAGAVDAVGGDTLAALISQTKRHGAVASFGLAGGHKLRTTVFPFILRGVSLLGIDSNTCPADRRLRAWTRLSREIPVARREKIIDHVISLEQIPAECERLLQGDVKGRVIVDVSLQSSDV